MRTGRWKRCAGSFRSICGTGLSAAEVEVRQRHYGENELREAPPRSLIVRIGAQLCDSLIFVLFAAAGSPCFWASTAMRG